MHTNAVLTLTQWLSPAYPVGSFAYSHGLETAVENGWVKDSTQLEAWFQTILHHGAGFADALFLAAAWKAQTPDQINAIDTQAKAFAASKERLFETTQQGGAFAAVTNATWQHNITARTYPVALGVSAAAQGIDLKLTQEMYLHAFLSNLIAAAQRLLPVGQTQGQQILHRLTADIPATAHKAQSGDLTALTSTAFMADIAAMQHETQTTRIFRT